MKTMNEVLSRSLMVLLGLVLISCGGDNARVEKYQADLSECERALTSRDHELERCNTRISNSVEVIAENLEAVLYSSREVDENSDSPETDEEPRDDSPEITTGAVERPSVDVDQVLAMSRQIVSLFEEQQRSSEDLRRRVRRLSRQVADTGSMTGEKLDVVQTRTEDISERVDRAEQLERQIQSLERQLGTLHQDILRRTDAVGALVRDFNATEINCPDCGWFGNKTLRNQITGFHNDLLDELDALPDLDWSPVAEEAGEGDPDESTRVGPPV